MPRLNVDRLSEAEARRIIAADGSGAIASAPGQPTVLFVDLGRFDHDPALAELRREDGTPLIVFECTVNGYWSEDLLMLFSPVPDQEPLVSLSGLRRGRPRS